MKKLAPIFALVLTIASMLSLLTLSSSEAQNTTCADRPNGDVSNACANTRFVHNNGGGGGGTPGGSNLQVQYNNLGTFGGYTNAQLTALIQLFTNGTSGAVPISPGGTTEFLRADGTWAVPNGGSAIVGTILPWTGATVPTGYLLAYGQAVSRATYPTLLSTLELSAGITCTSSNPTVTVPINISDRATIGAAVEAPGCFTVGTTVLSKSSGSVTLSTNAIASTTAALAIFPWGNGDGSTTFNVPNLQGRVLAGRDNMSGTIAGVLTSAAYGSNPDAMGAVGGEQSITLQTANLPPYTPAGTITNGAITISSNAAAQSGGSSTGGGAFPLNFPSPASISASQGASSFAGTPQGGTADQFPTIQPSLTIDWIIKALADTTLPDDNITVGVTTITGGNNTNIIYDNAGVVGEYALATANQYSCATSGVIVQPSVVYQAETTTAYAASITFDFCTFKNTAVTLTGNITTMNFSNVVAGKAGMITFIQDGSGSHTTVWNSILKFTGGVTPTLTTTAGAVDILTYACRSATFCGASLLTDVR